MIGLDAQIARDRGEKRLGLPGVRLAGRPCPPRRSARRSAPDRLAVAPPVEREGPARQRSRPDTICPGRNAGSRRARSGRAAGGSACRRASRLAGRRRRCSTRRLEIVDRDEGRLAAHGQPHVAPRARRRPAPERVSAAQASSENGFVMRGCSATRRPHVEAEIHLGIARASPRSARRCGNAACGQRDVALAGQQAGCRDQGRSSRRRAGRPRPRHAGR
jgi:hypothetical protein